MTFLITDASGANIGAGEYVTDETGRIVLTGLTPGMTVIAREVKTVRGYALNGTPQIIQIGDGGASLQAVGAVRSTASGASGGNALTFTDSPLSTLVIHNYVDGTDSQPLPGSTFKVLDGSGKPVGNSDGIYVADEHGDITIPELEQGTVLKVRQVKTVGGYLLNGQAQDIEIRSSDLHELTFWNTPKSSLTVVKLDRLTERPLSGAEFKVTTADGAAVDQDEGRTSTNGIYRTDEHGRFTITGLTPGSYVVTEVKAPQGHVLDAEAQTVKVNANDAQTLTFRDSPTQALTVEIYVTDSDTPIPGTTFLILDQDGKPVGNSNGEYIADENGRISVPGLAPGMSVYHGERNPGGRRLYPGRNAENHPHQIRRGAVSPLLQQPHADAGNPAVCGGNHGPHCRSQIPCDGRGRQKHWKFQRRFHHGPERKNHPFRPDSRRYRPGGADGNRQRLCAGRHPADHHHPGGRRTVPDFLQCPERRSGTESPGQRDGAASPRR